MTPPVCPLHNDPLDPPMTDCGIYEGYRRFECPKCSVTIDRPIPADNEPQHPHP